MTTTPAPGEASPAPPPPRFPRWPTPALTLLGLGWVALAAWLCRTYFVDDAYITFRYVDNLWRGDGFVFNPPERVEGLTNLGWALALIPLAPLLEIPVAAKLLGLVLLVGCLWLVLRVGWAALEGEGAAVAAAATLVLTASSIDLVYFALAGMETALAAILSLVGVRLLQRRPDAATAVALVGVGLFLVRPELVVVFPLFLLVRWVSTRDLPLRPFAVFLAGVALVTAARLAYFGRALPITGSSKSAAGAEILGRALDSLTQANENLPPPFSGLLALAILAVGYAAWRRRQPEAAGFAAAAVATSLLFAFYAPVDWTLLGRYFAPAVPIASLLLVAGCHEIAARLLPTRRELATTATLLLVIGLAAGGLYRSLAVLEPYELDRYPGYIMKSDSLIEPARWIADNVPAEATIATRRIGALGFIAGRHVYDYKFGLSDAEVAGLVRRHGPLDDPRHADLAASWRAHAPDYILEDVHSIENWIAPATAPLEVEVHGTLYREIRRFAIGNEIEWCLLGAVAADTARPNTSFR